MERSSRWPPVIICVCVLLAFGRLFVAQFTWFDDHGTIVDNKYFGQTVDIGHFWAHPAADIYAPLTYTAWGVLAKVTWVPTPDETGAHVDPRFFHGANVLVHLAASLLVYALLRQLLLKPWAALMGALLFALHPLQVEAVAWASGLKDVLAGMLSILALLLYAHYVQSNRRGLFIAATAVFVAALLAKPSAVTTPLIAAAMDRWLIGRSWKRIAPPLLIWLALCAPIVAVNHSAQSAAHAGIIPAWFRPVVAGNAITFYICKLVAPVGLAIQYSIRPQDLFATPWAYFGWVIPGVIAIAMIASRQGWLIAGAVIFVAAPLTVLGFVPFDWQWYSAVADHYTYMALLGPAIVFAGAIARANRAALVAGAICVVTLGVLSFRQAGAWKDNTTLALRTLAVNPRSFVAYTMLGAERIPTDPQAAIDDFKSALKIEPTYTKVLATVTPLLEARGRIAELRSLTESYVAAEETLPPRARDDLRGAKRFLEDTRPR